MATYKEKNFIADEKPQKVRPGKRNSPEREYLKTLGSSKERVQDWEDRGLDRRAAFASTAIDEIIEELKNIQNRKEVQPGDLKRLSELTEAFTDVQQNGENSKWVKDHAEEYYGRTPDPDEYIREEKEEPKEEESELSKASKKAIETGKPVGVGEYLTLTPKTLEEQIDEMPTTDEMADFQKSLDDYASKNKKGRDDIPVTTRR
jgi:hypothetical protein